MTDITQNTCRERDSIKGRTMTRGPCFISCGSVDVVEHHPRQLALCDASRVLAGMDLGRGPYQASIAFMNLSLMMTGSIVITGILALPLSHLTIITVPT